MAQILFCRIQATTITLILPCSKVQLLNSAEPFQYLDTSRITPDVAQAEKNLFCLFTYSYTSLIEDSV